MLTRLLSGIVLILILAVTLGFGGPVLWGFTIFISLIGYFELVRATKIRAEENKVCAVEIAGYIGIILFDVSLLTQVSKPYSVFVILLTILSQLCIYVLTFPKYHSRQIMAAGFGLIYAPVMLSFIYQTRSIQHGQYLVWLIFCASWASDTAAYCFGRLFGKHKLAPVLSPKKTIEGAIGGIFGAALIGFLYAFILLKVAPQAMPGECVWTFPLISAVGAVASQIGDLAASGIKRNNDIKDYGKLIPGHGGIMDRFDSVIVTAPLIYYLSMFLISLNIL